MSLIELLESPGWADALRRSLDAAIQLLQTDRSRLTSSAVDDARTWLMRGGAPYALERFREQLAQRRLPEERQDAALGAMRLLLDEHRRPLLDLMAAGVIPATRAAVLHACDLSEGQLDALWDTAQRGELPWEQALRAQGVPEEFAAGLRRAIAGWLESQRPAPPDEARQN
jgi:hypothetical protein